MAPAGTRPRTRQVSLWRRPLLVGICFGLGYGVTQRLLDLRLPGFVQWGQSFDVRQMPGEGLDKLRLRVGDAVQDLRGGLDLDQLEAIPTPPEQQPAAEAGSGDAAAEQQPAALKAPQEAPPAPALPPPPPASRQAGPVTAPAAPSIPTQP